MSTAARKRRTTISRTAARAVLREIQLIADHAPPEDEAISDNEFGRKTLARLIGNLEGRVPSAEWNRVDIFRRRRDTRGQP